MHTPGAACSNDGGGPIRGRGGRRSPLSALRSVPRARPEGHAPGIFVCDAARRVRSSGLPTLSLSCPFLSVISFSHLLIFSFSLSLHSLYFAVFLFALLSDLYSFSFLSRFADPNHALARECAVVHWRPDFCAALDLQVTRPAFFLSLLSLSFLCPLWRSIVGSLVPAASLHRASTSGGAGRLPLSLDAPPRGSAGWETGGGATTLAAPRRDGEVRRTPRASNERASRVFVSSGCP